MDFKKLLKIDYSGMNIGIYLVASTIVGGLLGYYLDTLFKTRPVLFLIFLLLGIVEGFRNIFKSVGKMK